MRRIDASRQARCDGVDDRLAILGVARERAIVEGLDPFDDLVVLVAEDLSDDDFGGVLSSLVVGHGHPSEIGARKHDGESGVAGVEPLTQGALEVFLFGRGVVHGVLVVELYHVAGPPPFEASFFSWFKA